LRVLQVVTLVSGAGAFGGPTRVAVNQCEALNARGHDTLLVGGSADLPLSTSRMGAASVRLFPTRLVAGSKPMTYLWSPSMLRWLWRHVGDFDVVHVHLARDGVALPAAVIARRRRRPYVVQTHGMVIPRGIAHRAVDRLATRRVLRDAATVFALRTQEIGQLTAVLGAPRRIDLLPNGIAPPPATAAASISTDPEFLFLARLHPRKRAPRFVDAAAALLATGLQASFTLVGPDEGDGAAVNSAIAEFAARHPSRAGALRWTGALAPQEISARMAAAYAYVLPSVDEPFPMTVLEAMAAGKPVIVTDSNGLAGAVRDHGAGIVVPDDSVQALVEAMQRLASEPALAERMGREALAAVREKFSIDAVANTLEGRYRAATSTTKAIHSAHREESQG
jgi:glycosyltransferase involved in cell wall biosynthesis